MKRLPSEFVSTPPSPRTDSVTRIPFTDGGQTIPVGWNCTNSMLSRVAPARRASAWPSPVYSQELLVTLKDLPMPPVASTTVGAAKTRNEPVSRQYPKAPAIRRCSPGAPGPGASPAPEPSVNSSVTVHSAKTLSFAS
jgi:hypothetical protein